MQLIIHRYWTFFSCASKPFGTSLLSGDCIFANAEIPNIMTGTITKSMMRRVVISPGVRIWYRFRIPPSCRTVEFPAKVGPRKEDGDGSNSDGA